MEEPRKESEIVSYPETLLMIIHANNPWKKKEIVIKMSVQNGQIGLNGQNVLLHVMGVPNLESGSVPYPEI